jgi:hypothetical protein
VNDLRDQSAPSGLMRCANATPIVAMKIFVEIDVVAKMRVVLKYLVLSVNGSSIFFVTQIVARQPSTQFGGNLINR